MVFTAYQKDIMYTYIKDPFKYIATCDIDLFIIKFSKINRILWLFHNISLPRFLIVVFLQKDLVTIFYYEVRLGIF